MTFCERISRQSVNLYPSIIVFLISTKENFNLPTQTFFVLKSSSTSHDESYQKKDIKIIQGSKVHLQRIWV